MCLAVPGKIVSVSGEDPFTRVGRIDFGGVFKEASLAYVPEAQVGDYVIVHVGFAISRVDQEEAEKIFEYLREMQSLSELEETGAEADSDSSGASPPAPPDTSPRGGPAARPRSSSTNTGTPAPRTSARARLPG